MGGDHATSVPPLIETRKCPPEKTITGNKACMIRVMLPAVPVSKEKTPPLAEPGENKREEEPMESPSTSADDMADRARTAVR